MSDNIIFDLYHPLDAIEMAELFNRNRFHMARHKQVTADDFFFIFRCREPYFTVVAKKKGKIIATVGAYPVSDQSVAGKNQVYIGWFLVDMLYRLSYSVILGLYQKLMEELSKTDVEEILTIVHPDNVTPLHMTLKCGFVILSDARNEFGRIKLHNFTPALGRYAGIDGGEIDSQTFVSSLPKVDKKEVRKVQPKPLIRGRYIECDYLLDGAEVTLLFDVVNAKIDGGEKPKSLKVYPDFDTEGRYVIENRYEDKSVEVAVELIMEEESGQENVNYSIVLKQGESEVVECAKEVSVFKFKHNDKWYNLYPNRIREIPPYKEPIDISFGDLNLSLDPSTGFISVMDNEESLVSLLWPCATVPYLDGVNEPRIKNLSVEQTEQTLTIVEDTNQVCLVRKCILSGDKMKIITTLTCKEKKLDVRPISQIYARKGVKGYRLRSGDKEMTFGETKISHQRFAHSDYPYWDSEPERYADFPVEEVSIEYPTATVDITFDKRAEFIDHAPLFISTLDFDEEKFLEKQVIEELEVCLTRRASNK